MNTTNEAKILKTSTNYWAQEIGGVLIVSVIFPVLSILYWSTRSYVLIGLGILYLVIYLLRDFRVAHNAQIIFNEFEMRGNVAGFAFIQAWTGIKAVTFSGRGVESLLVIGTETEVLQIPCRFFARKELEEELRKYLPSEVFNPLAFQRIHQAFEQERKSQFENLSEPLKVSLGVAEKFIGGVSVFLGILLLGLFIFKTDNILSLILAVFFGVLGFVLIVFSIGTIKANNEMIVLKTVLQRYELSWNTLREVYINTHNYTIVLTGDTCRIILPSTTRWSGQDRELLYDLIIVKMETMEIQPKQGTKPLYWRSKNF